MSLLLAALMLTCSAGLASLMAWLDTKGRLALASMGFFGCLALVLIGVGFSLREGDAVATAGDATPTPLPPTPTPIPTPMVDAVSDDAFVIEAATEPGAFELPTSFALGDDGSLYVGYEHGIDRARDLDGDGFYEEISHFGHEGGWVFGLDLHDGALYAAIDGSVVRLRDVDGDGVADDETKLLSGLPQEHYGGHSNSGLVVTDDGVVYMTVGGTSDHGPELEPLGGTILTMTTAGGTADIYATGLRNPYDIAFCPDGRLYASDNGPDEVAEGVGETAPDEVNLLRQGGDYGYPRFFGMTDASTGTVAPIALLPLNAGATGLICHDGTGLPDGYEGNLFVTLWGTFNSPTETGRRVMRVQLAETADGGVEGTVSEFASGFGHPIDILEDRDGSLLVLDFEDGQIFRIRYAGE
jgi:glucose/arabinose dehydrogenase